MGYKKKKLTISREESKSTIASWKLILRDPYDISLIALNSSGKRKLFVFGG